MLLSRDYTYTRIAALTDQKIQEILGRYYQDMTVSEARQVRDELDQAFPGKGDLLLEWMLESLSLESGMYPDGTEEFKDRARFYFQNVGNPKFRKAVDEFAAVHEIECNYKNILEFSLHDLYEIEELFNQLEVDPRVNKLSKKLPAGSEMFYNDGTFQIVRVKTPAAACELGLGTRWCTKNYGTAEDYLAGGGSLYVIYKNGKKIAQLDVKTLQLQNLQNKSFTIDDPLRQALIKSGLMDRILPEIGVESQGYNTEKYFERFAGDHPDPHIAEICSKDARLAHYYAGFILKGSFPEGEPAIALVPDIAVSYAAYVLKGRFKLGEKEIFESGFGPSYIAALKGINPGQWKELWDGMRREEIFDYLP